jgi:hypothetical protein
MTAPLPNDLKPEVVEALAYEESVRITRKKADDTLEIYGSAAYSVDITRLIRSLSILATEVERLHAERAGAVEGLPEGCPETAFFGPGSGLVFNPEYGDLHDVLVEIHPVGTRARLQASPREPWQP